MPARHGLRGTFGMSCDRRTFAITALVSDGPAARAGARVGDIIVMIDGTAVTALADSQVWYEFLEGETLTAGDIYRFGLSRGDVVAITAVEQ
jgi:C-terminal processing protease CtpA/Prc